MCFSSETSFRAVQETGFKYKKNQQQLIFFFILKLNLGDNCQSDSSPHQALFSQIRICNEKNPRTYSRKRCTNCFCCYILVSVCCQTKHASFSLLTDWLIWLSLAILLLNLLWSTVSWVSSISIFAATSRVTILVLETRNSMTNFWLIIRNDLSFLLFADAVLQIIPKALSICYPSQPES